MRINSARSIILAALAGLLACAGGGAGPSGAGDSDNTNNMVDVVGTYELKTFTTTAGGVTTDQLEAGADLTLTLNPDNTMTGQLVVPKNAGGTVAVVAMTGTWTLTGSTLRFEQNADTFVRQMPFEVTPNRLDGHATLKGTTFNVSLTR